MPDLPKMKLYFAAVYTNKLELSSQSFRRMDGGEQYARLHCDNILESYHYIKKDSFVAALRRDGKKVFLDSGAFSAHSSGEAINISDYMAYIHANRDIIEQAAVLDVIGNADKTWENQATMEANGLRPLPCFHYGEDTAALVYYLDNYEYFALGGMAMLSAAKYMPWLDSIWQRFVSRPDGTPRAKLHGFGLTSFAAMARYPWHSVDSVSWMAFGANGWIVLPTTRRAIQISSQSSTRKIADRHVDTLPDAQRAAVLKLITDAGFDPDRLRKEYIARWAFNMRTYQIYEHELKQKNPVFTEEQIGIF